MIRGKGSIKEGKLGRRDGTSQPGDTDGLHAMITAPTHASLKKAVEKVLTCPCI